MVELVTALVIELRETELDELRELVKVIELKVEGLRVELVME